VCARAHAHIKLPVELVGDRIHMQNQQEKQQKGTEFQQRHGVCIPVVFSSST